MLLHRSSRKFNVFISFVLISLLMFPEPKSCRLDYSILQSMRTYPRPPSLESPLVSQYLFLPSIPPHFKVLISCLGLVASMATAYTPVVKNQLPQKVWYATGDPDDQNAQFQSHLYAALVQYLEIRIAKMHFGHCTITRKRSKDDWLCLLTLWDCRLSTVVVRLPLKSINMAFFLFLLCVWFGFENCLEALFIELFALQLFSKQIFHPFNPLKMLMRIGKHGYMIKPTTTQSDFISSYVWSQATWTLQMMLELYRYRRPNKQLLLGEAVADPIFLMPRLSKCPSMRIVSFFLPHNFVYRLLWLFLV